MHSNYENPVNTDTDTEKDREKDTEKDTEKDRNTSSLIEYRNAQAQELKLRLDIFLKSTISKYNSLDMIKEASFLPINSEKDVMIINKLIELKTFITIPVYVTNKCDTITHFYTIGLWYYWGLPELIIKFNEPVNQNVEIVNIIINIIHDKLFTLYKDRLLSQGPGTIPGKKINLIDFNLEPAEYLLDLEKFDVKIKLNKMDDTDIMDFNTLIMLWFYTYYMDGQFDQNNEPKLYPTYTITYTETEYKLVAKKIIDKILDSAMDRMDRMDCMDGMDDSENEQLSDSENEQLSHDDDDILKR